jgi:hypothetical protein
MESLLFWKLFGFFLCALYAATFAAFLYDDMSRRQRLSWAVVALLYMLVGAGAAVATS